MERLVPAAVAVLRRVSPSHTRVFVSSSLLLKKRRANFSSERRTAHDAVADQRRGPSRGCGFASARRHLGVAPAGSRVARGKMGSAPGLTDVERPRASAEATTPTKAVDAMRVSTGHRLSFGIGGVSENDPKPAIGTHEFGETVRERQHASVTRRASRIARRYPRVVLPPLFRMVNFPRAAVGSRLGSRANARATLPKAQLTTPDVTSFLYRQAMFGASGDAVHGADASDKERTPQTKFKTTTAVLGKSPNTVFSPLSVMSEATAPGDNSLDSSFSDDVAEIATEGQCRDVASKVLAAPASPRDDAEVGASESATPPVAADVDAADEEDLSHSWLRRRRPSSSVSPALSPNAPLLTSLAPSVDEAMIHRRVSELRIALRAAEGALDKTRARFEDSEANRREAEAESAALRARVWTLEGAEALSGSRLHDGSLDLLRGELLNEATAELEEAARATADAESRASDAVDALRQAEDAATAVVSAANAEVEALSLEAAQARFRAQAESRDAAAARGGARRRRGEPRRGGGGGGEVARRGRRGRAARSRTKPPGSLSPRRRRPGRLPRTRSLARGRRRSTTPGCSSAFASSRMPRARTRGRATAPSSGVCARSARRTPRRPRTCSRPNARCAASSRRSWRTRRRETVARAWTRPSRRRGSRSNFATRERRRPSSDADSRRRTRPPRTKTVGTMPSAWRAMRRRPSRATPSFPRRSPRRRPGGSGE